MVLWPPFIFVTLFVLHAASAEPTKILITDKEEKGSVGLSSEQPIRLFSEDIYWSEPQVGVSGGSNRPRYLQIRGVGEASSYENTPSHSVGYWVQDIDLTGIVSSWPALDISRVHVYKGPQSVLYGGSSIGGLVETQLLPMESSGKVSAAYETGNLRNIGVTSPVFNTLRFSFHHLQSDGFYKNNFNGSSGAAQNENYVHLQFKIKDTETWRITSHHLGLAAENVFDMWSLDNSYRTLSDQPGKDDQKIHGHSLKIERKMSGEASFISLGSVTFSQSEYSYDADWGNNDYWNSIPGWNQPYDYFDRFIRNRLVWHEKLYYTQGPSSYGVHVYGLREKSSVDHFKNKVVNSFTDSRYESLHGALFVDHRWSVAEQHGFQVSGRVEKQEVRYADTDLSETRDSEFLYAWVLGYESSLSEATTVHARISRGFRGSGVNVDSSLSAEDRFYRPEYLINYEVGAEIKQGGELFSLDVFYMDQKDKQVRVSRQDDPMDPGTFTYLTNNAANVQAYGLEARWKKGIGRWEIEIHGSVLKSKFQSYNFENVSYDGRETANAPEWGYAVGVSRYWTDRFSSAVSWSGKDASYFSNNHDQKSNNFSQVHVSSQYAVNRWSFDLWIKNIFDRKNEIRGFYFANEPPDWNNKLYVQYGAPRRFGGSAIYTF